MLIPARYLLVLCVVVAGCLPGAPLNPTPQPETVAQVNAACTTTPYRNCVRDAIELIRSVPHHTLIAICDLGDGNGSVITIPSVDTADRDCTEGFTILGSVVAVIPVP